MDKTKKEFERLLKIMAELRQKCPWDKKQSFDSLRKFTIEETYELVDAITEKEYYALKDELGDLMLHIVFYAVIAQEKGLFTIYDILKTICDKLVKRHPHIYGNLKVKNSDQVKENWEKIKLKEQRKSILNGIPKSLPALIKAYRIQEKVKSVGFDWEQREDVWQKIDEEYQELKKELNNKKKLEQEFGDLLFALVNAARLYDIDPEQALEKTNKKFIRRFMYIEQCAQQTGKDIDKMTLQEMDQYWEQAKQKEKNPV